MSIRWIVARILRDELISRGIRSLTDSDYQEIASAIFARVTEIELQLAATDLDPPRKPTGTKA